MRKLFILPLLCILVTQNLFAEELVRPGTVNKPGSSAWDAYRSFHKEPEMTALFADSLGIRTRCFLAGNTINRLGEYYCQYPPVWIGTGNYNWANLDRQIEDLLACSPSATLICMIDLNTPYWATRRYEMDSFEVISHLASSEKWRKDTEEWLDAFLKYSESKYGDKIFAYILSGGGTSEWLDHMPCHSSKIKDASWVEWCKKNGKKYESSAPSPARLRTAAFKNTIFDPQTQQDVIDYWRFHNEAIADALLEFADFTRQRIPRSKQLGAFFGYSFRHGDHQEYEKVYKSTCFDFFISPAQYSNREIGAGTGSKHIFGTSMLYGKRLMHEIDCRPHGYGKGNFNIERIWKSEEDDIAGNMREACFAIINHGDLWWFDMWGHFYDQKSVQQTIGKAHEIFERFKDDNSASVSEVLYLADPESHYYTNLAAGKGYPFGSHFQRKLSGLGLPFDIYSLSDVTRLDLSQYKLICLPATMVITPDTEKLLKERICRDGRTVLWSFAPGICDGKTLDTSRVERWAGVPYGTSGINETDMGGWKAIYCANPGEYDSANIREICLKAGIHSYVDETIPVFANERLLCIHCKKGGVKTIHLKRKAKKVVELISGKTVAKGRKDFSYEFSSPDTRLFDPDSSEQCNKGVRL